MVQPYIPKKKSAEAILEFYKQSTRLANRQWNLRSRFEEIDRQYQREMDLTEEQYKAKLANKRGDTGKFQNVTVPVVMPQVEAAVTYQQSVFLDGFPIFGVSASPEHADAAMQMDTVLADEQVKANWVPNFLKALRNGFKYNLGPIEVSWESKTSYALEASEIGGDDTDKQKQVIWAGNHIRCLDPYNTFWDTRVHPIDVPLEAEFAGYTMLKSRVAFKKFLAELPTRINAKEALESGSTSFPAGGHSGTENFYIPRINPEAIYDHQMIGGTDWNAWAGIAHDTNSPRINYRNLYEVTVIYGRILPDDFKMTDVPGPNTPQVWKFIIVNNQVVVYAERMTNAHNLIPIFFCVPKDDGMGYQTKSFSKDVEPFQEINTALANSLIAARRRSIADRMLYDPSRVSAGVINNDEPAARIPVRPSAFGTDLRMAVHQIPFEDSQSQYILQNIQGFSTMADQVSGLNPARQGRFVRGNKTRFEFAEVMNNANGRDQAVALALEGNFFGPIKEVIKINILQYQGKSSVFNREAGQMVSVDPIMLRKAALEFKVADGLLPTDKLIDGESLAMAFQTLAASPQLGQGYNLTPMFSYLMKMRGAKLQPFEKSPEQLAYEQAVQTWQQTIMAIIQEAQNLEPQPTLEEIMAQAPPQPTPEQYGYNPSQPQVSAKNSGQTAYGMYADVAQQQAQAMQQAAGAQQGGGQGEAASATGAGPGQGQQGGEV